MGLRGAAQEAVQLGPPEFTQGALPSGKLDGVSAAPQTAVHLGETRAESSRAGGWGGRPLDQTSLGRRLARRSGRPSWLGV